MSDQNQEKYEKFGICNMREHCPKFYPIENCIDGTAELWNAERGIHSLADTLEHKLVADLENGRITDKAWYVKGKAWQITV